MDVRARLRLTRSEPALNSDAGIQAAVRAHAGELYGFARRALGDSAAAEDAVQETFVRAWRASGRFDPALGSLRAWLFAILRNVIIDAVRSRHVRADVVSAEVEVPESDRVEEVLRCWLVEEALRRLTPEHRHAVVEVYFNGRPATEVASDAGVPAGTIRTRLFYALKALRLSLDELGWDDA